MAEELLKFIVLMIVVSVLAGGILFCRRRWLRLAFRESRVLLTGGGTGGHVNPALAIAEEIRKREPGSRFLYVGVKNKAEAVIVRKAGYPLRFVQSRGFPGLSPSPATLAFLGRLTVGVFQALWILLVFCPRWVVATGGYVSAPVILAAMVLRFSRLSSAKVFLHEQNSVPGQLNGLLGRWVDRVLLTFPQTLCFFRGNGAVVGYPIRHSIVPKPREEALKNLSFPVPPGRQVVFVFGGSQGARTLNRAIVDALRYFLPYRDRLFIVHGVGLGHTDGYDAAEDTRARMEKNLSPEELDQVREFYYAQEYYHNIADVYSVSDLIVCRSGAGSLNEISRMGKPALLVPKANLPGDHQVMNARAMKHVGAAEVLFEDTVIEDGMVLEKVEGEVLAGRVLRLLQDPRRLERMASCSRRFLRRHATERIVSELFDDHSYDNGLDAGNSVFSPLLNNRRLLHDLAVLYRGDPARYDPLKVIGDEDDLLYYRHRAAALLTHEAWQDRNMGVKLIGLTLYEQKIPALLHMLMDRTPVNGLKRFWGGDYEQVGFIRRNVVQALRVLNRWDGRVEASLLAAVEDPYFEVRSQVCVTATHFGSCLAGKEAWFEALVGRLEDRCFEVVVEAARAIGEVGVDGRALEALLGLGDHFYWQVRNAAMKGILRLLERHVISPSLDFLKEIDRFILTSTDFRPHFSIKESYRAIDSHCRERLVGKRGTEDMAILYDAVQRKR